MLDKKRNRKKTYSSRSLHSSDFYSNQHDTEDDTIDKIDYDEVQSTLDKYIKANNCYNIFGFHDIVINGVEKKRCMYSYYIFFKYVAKYNMKKNYADFDPLFIGAHFPIILCGLIAKQGHYKFVETGNDEDYRLVKRFQYLKLTNPICYINVDSIEGAGNAKLLYTNNQSQISELFQNNNLVYMANNPSPNNYPFEYLHKLQNYKAVILCLDKNNPECDDSYDIPDDYKKFLLYKENKSYIEYLSNDNYFMLNIYNEINEQDIIISIDKELLFNIKDELSEVMNILDSTICTFYSGVYLNNKKIKDVVEFNEIITNIYTPKLFWNSTIEKKYLFSTDKKPKEIKTLIPLSNENKKNDFSNYKVITDYQRLMYSYAINFVNAIVNRKELEPIGFFMIGEAGIGKTHLCVAIAKMIAKLGLNVLFLNEEAFKQIEPQSFITNCKKLIDKSDLVVIDDLNKEFSSFNELFHIALEYTIMEDKAILVSSNKDFNISKFIFKYEIDLNKPFKNFFITNNIIGESYRKAWFDGKFTITDIEKMSLSQKIDILSEYKGENPASIVIESDDIDLSSVKKDFLDKSNIKSKKVKIVAPSTGYMGKVSQDYDVFIIKVTNQKECMQMFNLIPKIHNEGKKAIFVIDNKEKFRDLVITTLNDLFFEDESKKLKDRIKYLIPVDIFEDIDKEKTEEMQIELTTAIPEPVVSVPGYSFVRILDKVKLKLKDNKENLMNKNL